MNNSKRKRAINLLSQGNSCHNVATMLKIDVIFIIAIKTSTSQNNKGRITNDVFVPAWKAHCEKTGRPFVEFGNY